MTKSNCLLCYKMYMQFENIGTNVIESEAKWQTANKQQDVIYLHFWSVIFGCVFKLIA